MSLLEQTLNLAEVHRDRVRFEEAATTPVEIDDNAIDRAARALLSSSAMTHVVNLVARITGLDRSDSRINGWLKECGL